MGIAFSDGNDESSPDGIIVICNACDKKLESKKFRYCSTDMVECDRTYCLDCLRKRDFLKRCRFCDFLVCIPCLSRLEYQTEEIFICMDCFLIGRTKLSDEFMGIGGAV